MPPSPLRLENIPVEILTRVCQYVGLLHRPSLLSFALANKRCHSLAKKFFFHTIQFSTGFLRQFELDVGECIRILDRNEAFSDVRILLITDRSQRNWRLDRALVSAHSGTGSWSFGLPLSVSEMVDADKDRLQGLERRSSLVLAETQKKSPDITSLTHTAWQQLARLLQMLQGLGDLLYAGESQVPPCLLQALLQFRPRCRLHVFTFTLRSLLLPETDPNELALVTAPCLYSIWMWYRETQGYDDDGLPSYEAEAVYSMVTGLAPNLKEAHLFREVGHTIGYGEEPEPPCPPWKGFTNVGQDFTRIPARLESLTLGLNHCLPFSRFLLDKDVVDGWITKTNLSSLRALRISRLVSHGALESLIGANSFPCLTTLLFTCAGQQDHAYYDGIKQFIHGLPQLTSLEIIAWPPDESLSAALPHGLRELWLRTQDVLGQGLDQAAILELATCCPRIETLALKIRRSRGSAAEVALYRALGRFANSRRLVLTLDASPAPWFPATTPHEERSDDFNTGAVTFDTAVDPSFDDSDKEYLDDDLFPYRRGHIRDVFINTAVDETLARAIFDTVCAAKASAHGHGAALALERVMIQAEGGRSFPHRGGMMPTAFNLIPYMQALGRCWLLERDMRDDARHVVHAREIHGELRLRMLRPYRDDDDGSYEDESVCMSIFRRIWPKRPGGEAQWYNDWHSWPLSETA
ncbi:uncharacterized protein B0H64DRAFT_169614 [Chaetomium fimeti]|uniref:F-box domain-containing protein n=1 Tax=Chaetomium fimeti TaxID=1854472 RepID=A0AAE0HGZ9_9PEZI|nr:hypothetical protein B0H64DRAFT_169614 [Chaetomium fimeti]